jgi:hypothetical protein
MAALIFRRLCRSPNALQLEKDLYFIHPGSRATMRAEAQHDDHAILPENPGTQGFGPVLGKAPMTKATWPSPFVDLIAFLASLKDNRPR